MRDTRMRRSVGQYVRDMTTRNLSEEYVSGSRHRLLRFAEWMEERNVLCVSRLDTATLSEYLESTRRYSASYQALNWSTIRQFLKYHESPAVSKFKWKPLGRDRQVQWLTEDQFDFLLTQPMTPREAFMITASALGMLRRVEVLRLKLADLHLALKTGHLSVWAKGKVRTIPVHPDLKMSIQAYLATQDREPGEPAIDVSKAYYSTILKGVERRTGVPCTAHVLRRTGLRMLNKLGVPLPTISAIAGHSDPMMTLRYIGQPMDEMTEAINRLCTRSVRQTVEPGV